MRCSRIINLLASQPALTDLRESTLACERGEDGRERAVQEDLTETQLEPVPEEQALKHPKGGGERKNAGREEMRDARADGRPETDENDPRRQYESCEYGRDEAWGHCRFGIESVLDRGERVKCRFVGVLRRGQGRGYGEVEEVELGRGVGERADYEGNFERYATAGWEGRRRTSHVEFEFSFSCRGRFHWLDAFLAGVLVEESEEGLVRLHTLAFVLFHDLECQFQRVARIQHN